MGKRVTREGRFREVREWKDDPYDPRHYNADDPSLKARGLKRYAWLLIVGALTMVLSFAILHPIDGVLFWYYLSLQVGVALLAIAAGVKLIKKPRSRSRERENGREDRDSSTS